MSHRTAKHEKAYRKGKSALKSGATAKKAAASACTDFLDGVYKTVKEAAKIYEVDVMAVHRRLWYVPFLWKFPITNPNSKNFSAPSSPLSLRLLAILAALFLTNLFFKFEY